MKKLLRRKRAEARTNKNFKQFKRRVVCLLCGSQWHRDNFCYRCNLTLPEAKEAHEKELEERRKRKAVKAEEKKKSA